MKTAPAGLQQQFEFEKLLAAMMTEATEAIRQARSGQEQIEKLKKGAASELARSLDAFSKDLASQLTPPPGPGASAKNGLTTLNGQLSGLYGDIDSADAAPTAAQAAAMTKVAGEARRVLAGWKKFVSTDLAALNGKLKSAGLDEIKLSSKAPAAEEDDASDLE
ncbi:MAG: hypothetical protein U0Q18_08810 [Bryobacteraceae bacterium]